MVDGLLWRIFLVSAIAACWLAILLMLGIAIGGLILWGDLSAAIASLAEGADNLAGASSTLAGAVEDLARGPQLVGALAELVTALVDLFG